MKGHQKPPPAYLFFTRKERVGIICVVVLMMVYPCMPVLLTFLSKPAVFDHQLFEKDLASLKIQQEDSNTGPGYRNEAGYIQQYQSTEKQYRNYENKGQLFFFDPNTISVEDWIKLGIREQTANTIHKYLSRGGHFYKPEDISKIWGLHENDVERLLPYVRIDEDHAPGNNKYAAPKTKDSYGNSEYPTTMKSVEVNNSDTAAFIALPGIGSKLAARIVAFREKLGGFYKTEQIAETYGLTDSTFQKIRNRLVIGNSSIKKININTATVDELKAHPYLRYHIANAIVQYRTQHGNFSSVEEIKNILLVTGEIYGKAAPYLTVK